MRTPRHRPLSREPPRASGGGGAMMSSAGAAPRPAEVLPRRREATCGASRSRRATSVAGEARRGHGGRARVVWGASPRRALHVPAAPRGRAQPCCRPGLSRRRRPLRRPGRCCCLLPAARPQPPLGEPVHLHRPVIRLPRSPPRGRVKREGSSAWPGGDLTAPRSAWSFSRFTAREREPSSRRRMPRERVRPLLCGNPGTRPQSLRLRFGLMALVLGPDQEGLSPWMPGAQARLLAPYTFMPTLPRSPAPAGPAAP